MSASEKDPIKHGTPAEAIVIETEEDRLRRDIYRPDMEKFLLFTKMLRTNALYKKAKITHK